MVLMPNQSKIRPDSNGNPRPVVKMEIEDTLEEEHSPFNKRAKLTDSPTQHQQQDMYNNVLDEPSPLGLRLRKSPSLLDLIQMKLQQANPASSDSSKKEAKPSAVSSSNERLKASNFPANVLRIGTWECVSRYEGDLVAKCYYAKHKLVWEVLDGGLKSKIEIQWADIIGIKASCPEDGPGTLDVVLARPPLFFRETDPQPRKHTLWQATSDFTGGQASTNRRHFLQCPSGLLSKNFEKLVQCDPRLHLLSQQPEVVLESPYFEPRCAMFEDQLDGKKPHCFSSLHDEREPSFSGFIDQGSPSLSISTKSEGMDTMGRLSDFTPQTSSRAQDPSSSGHQVLKNPSLWEQLNAQGLIKASMSVDDLVNHLGNCISEQMTSGNSNIPGNSMPPKELLEDLAQYLLSDTQAASASDETSLMARVNSLCCLIQKDTNSAGGQNNTEPVNGNVSDENADSDWEGEEFNSKPTTSLNRDNNNNNNNVKEENPAGMSRKDSFGDLLLHLPRIASLPQFLFNISEDSENER